MSIDNNERRRKSQDKIEDAFVKLILTEDKKRINVSNVCKIAKVNRTTFYTNYIDLCDLISKIRYSRFSLLENILNDSTARKKENLIRLLEEAKTNQKFYYAWLHLFLERDCIMFSDFIKQEKNRFDSLEEYYFEAGFKQWFLAILFNYVRDGCPIEPVKMADNIIERCSNAVKNGE